MKDNVLSLIKNSRLLDEIHRKLSKHGALGVESLPDGARPLFLCAMNRPVLLITPEDSRPCFTRAIKSIAGAEHCVTLPPTGFYNGDTDPAIEAARNRVVQFIQEECSDISETDCTRVVIASPEALSCPVIHPDLLESDFMSFSVGQIIDRDMLIKKLIDFGYQRQPMTDRAGCFSIRGDILDIYAPGEENPWRIDFFDDEIECLRKFDPWSQRSRERIDGELSVPSMVPGDKTIQLLDLIPGGYLLVINDDLAVLDEFNRCSAASDTPTGKNDMRSFLKTAAGRKRLIFLSPGSPDRLVHRITAKGRKADFPDRRFETIKEELLSLLKHIKYLVVSSDSTTQCLRMKRIFSELELPSTIISGHDKTIHPGVINIHANFYGPGFVLSEISLALLWEDDIFGAKVRRPVEPHTTLDDAMLLQHFLEMEKGDLVVHADHGIGIYGGLKTLTVAGKLKDFLYLKYAGEDRLYVPVEKVHLVQKYVGSSDERPTLYSLGGNRWISTRKKARRAVEKIARELVKLYAARAVTQGHRFSADTVWQQELEASFPYQETEDQLNAIDQVTHDMESDTPMDRLICGDVGYGKTEVAIRAAFKAVMDGKQVAILCPTTILASQHYVTFSERLGPFPVEIQLLSRLKTGQEQRKTIKGLENGTVDVLIGTHRILSGDVCFKDLGLLIVDEEHRFGVKAKEKLKQFRHSVDVLSLTATPIPRTLQMALSDVRNMSIIKTPPRDRLPIITHVAAMDKSIVTKAIKRELQRDGQVFYLHNRVETIDTAVAFVKSCAPEASIKAAHGQMPRAKLERIMNDFLDRRIDVLVCSTIIESGLDIPEANTIIVSRSDALGLAQLYQIRGRVGRSGKQAYALLLGPSDGSMTASGRARLETISENTELGSGFKIAMKDLELRGAGNIIGYQQSGSIASVGFDMYCRLLREAICEFGGNPPPENLESMENIEISLDIHAHLPNEYIEDLSDKLVTYRKILSCKTRGSIQELADELRDRFGRIPLPASNLLAVQRLRICACRLGVRHIGKMGKTLRIQFDRDVALDESRVYQLSRHYPKLALLYDNAPILRVAQPDSRGEKLIFWIENLLQRVTGKDSDTVA